MTPVQNGHFALESFIDDKSREFCGTKDLLPGSVHCLLSPLTSFIKDTGYHCSQHPGEQE